jgi:hypothetical protein
MGSITSDPLILGRVIGDVIDYFTPTIKMTVTYNNKEIFNGYEVPFPSTVSTRPRIQIGGGDMRLLFTLVLYYIIYLYIYWEKKLFFLMMNFFHLIFILFFSYIREKKIIRNFYLKVYF